MGDKNIKKEVKKPKKSSSTPAAVSAVRPVVVQPTLITKKKKPL